jgi:hypothetical protein
MSALHLTLPACSGGLNLRDAQNAMPITDAFIYDNILHTNGADTVRKGYQLLTDDQTITNTAEYDDIFEYINGDNSRIIAISSTTLKSFRLDGTLAFSYNLGGEPRRINSAQFVDGAGQIHLIIAAVSEILDFTVDTDGTDIITQINWTDSDDNPLTETLVRPFIAKNRIWFIQEDSFYLWYSDLQSISGKLTPFFIGPFFNKSSKILCGNTWTQDGGTGPDDQICIFSDNGEVLIYRGQSPESEDFSIVGRFNTENLINERCVVQIKGDLVMATTSGIIPLSSVLNELSAAKVALSSKINPYIARAATDAKYWSVKYDNYNGHLLVIAPSKENSLKTEILVLNFENLTWSRYLGQNPNSIAIIGSSRYFCNSKGIWVDNIGYMDNNSPIIWRIQRSYQDFGIKYKKKIMRMLPRIKTDVIMDVYKYIFTNFTITDKTFVFDNVGSNQNLIQAEWDATQWDQVVWVDNSSKIFNIKAGIAHNPALYISVGLWGRSKSETVINSADIVMVGYNGTL